MQRVNGLRALASMEKGTPGPETSIGKLFRAPLVEEIADFALLALRARRARTRTTRGCGSSYQARGTSIAGGTTFIQRNIVAERVLGLPR